LTALFSPSQGVLVRMLRRVALRRQFAADLLVLHLHHHPRQGETIERLTLELNWSDQRLRQAIERSEWDKHVVVSAGTVSLTAHGQQAAESIYQSLNPALAGI